MAESNEEFSRQPELDVSEQRNKKFRKQTTVERAATSYCAQLLAEAKELLIEYYEAKGAKRVLDTPSVVEPAKAPLALPWRLTDQTARALELAIDAADSRNSKAQDAWTAVYDLERVLISALPPSRLERRAWIIRNRYREVAGASKFAIYDASRPQAKDGTTVDIDTLRADLMELHRELVREYIFANAMEEQRAAMSHQIAVMTLFLFFAVMMLFILAFIAPALRAWFLGLALVGLGVWIFWAYRGGRISRSLNAVLLVAILGTYTATSLQAQSVSPPSSAPIATGAQTHRVSAAEPHPDKSRTTVGDRVTSALATPADFPFDGLLTFLLVAFAGFMGGAFSVVRRLQAPTADGDAALNLQGLTAGESNVTLAPLSGAIAGLVLYLFFCGKLIEGTLFPTIFSPEIKSPTSFTSFITLLQTTGPQSGFDFAKVLVWCFVAGFAERLVPDAIDRLTSAAQKAGK